MRKRHVSRKGERRKRYPVIDMAGTGGGGGGGITRKGEDSLPVSFYTSPTPQERTKTPMPAFS
ncbi:hypothetical protein UQ42_04240 [Escherichia coli]|nr:hypothetical protein UQ42_04240 [Escherichia coli]